MKKICYLIALLFIVSCSTSKVECKQEIKQCCSKNKIKKNEKKNLFINFKIKFR